MYLPAADQGLEPTPSDRESIGRKADAKKDPSRLS